MRKRKRNRLHSDKRMSSKELDVIKEMRAALSTGGARRAFLFL